MPTRFSCCSRWCRGSAGVSRLWYYHFKSLVIPCWGNTVNVISLKLPPELNQALAQASRQRGVSKSAVVRDALVQVLQPQSKAASAAEIWIAQWQGSLRLPDAEQAAETDPRLAHLLAKHVR